MMMSSSAMLMMSASPSMMMARHLVPTSPGDQRIAPISGPRTGNDAGTPHNGASTPQSILHDSNSSIGGVTRTSAPSRTSPHTWNGTVGGPSAGGNNRENPRRGAKWAGSFLEHFLSQPVSRAIPGGDVGMMQRGGTVKVALFVEPGGPVGMQLRCTLRLSVTCVCE